MILAWPQQTGGGGISTPLHHFPELKCPQGAAICCMGKLTHSYMYASQIKQIAPCDCFSSGKQCEGGLNPVFPYAVVILLQIKPVHAWELSSKHRTPITCLSKNPCSSHKDFICELAHSMTTLMDVASQQCWFVWVWKPCTCVRYPGDIYQYVFIGAHISSFAWLCPQEHRLWAICFLAVSVSLPTKIIKTHLMKLNMITIGKHSSHLKEPVKEPNSRPCGSPGQLHTNNQSDVNLKNYKVYFTELQIGKAL